MSDPRIQEAWKESCLRVDAVETLEAILEELEAAKELSPGTSSYDARILRIKYAIQCIKGVYISDNPDSITQSG